MKDNTNRKSHSRKIISAALAVAMAATMLLSGTLAYFYQSRATNTLVGTEKNAIAHDDFFLVETKDDGTAVYNKDIYVENLGAEPIFVRVKLSEDFTLDGKPVTVGGADGKTLTPVTHIPETGTKANVGTGTYDKATAAEDMHKYFTWDMGNGSGVDKTRTFYLSAAGKAYHDETTDATTGEKTDPTPEIYITEEGVAQNISDTIYTAAPMANGDKTKALNLAQVITMKEYMAKTEGEQRVYVGWVIDNSDPKLENVYDLETGTTTQQMVQGDGWAYWSRPVNPYMTTGLLLNGVTVAKELADRNYTYNIHVDFEVVDKTDKGIWLGTKNTATNKPGTVTAEQVVTEGAQTLLRNVESLMMSAAEQQKVVELAGAMANAETEGAKKLYEMALNTVPGSEKNEFTQAKIEKLIHMAEDIEARKAAGENLTAAVLTLKKAEDSTWAIDTDNDGSGNPKTIDAFKTMDPKIARYIMDNYGGSDNVLTKEEALTVTSIQYGTSGKTVMNNLSGVSKMNFENLLGLELRGTIKDETFNEENLVLYEDTARVGTEEKTVKASVEIFLLEDGNGPVTALKTLDVSKLKDLNDLHLNRIKGPNFKIVGLDKLTNIRRIYLNEIDGTFTDIMVKGMIEKSAKLNYICIGLDTLYEADPTTGVIKTDGNGQPIKTTDISGFGFETLRNLTSFTWWVSNATGTIDLSACANLNTLRFTSTDLTVKVKDKAQIGLLSVPNKETQVVNVTPATPASGE